MTYVLASDHKELVPEDLRWICDPAGIKAKTTKDIEPIENIIGQERAIKALTLGVNLFSPGYNIFVTGLSGTGKATTIKKILDKINPKCPLPRDLAYVNNFRDPDRPVLLEFPRGQGRKFKEAMDETIDVIRERVPKIFEDENFIRQRDALINEYNEKEAKLFLEFEERIKENGFVLARVQVGQTTQPTIMPKIGEAVIPITELPKAVESKKLSEQEADRIATAYQEYNQDLQKIFREGIKLTREYQKKISDFEMQAAGYFVHAIFADLYETYTDNKVQTYLNAVERDILENIDQFKPSTSPQGGDEEPPEVSQYEVNLILDNTDTKGCPIIIESNPTYNNLFGGIERMYDMRGFWFSDFTNIKAGSVLQADGGYLVLSAFDVATDPMVWKKLKRVLLSRKLEIQVPDVPMQLATTTVKPEPIELNLKVILLGSNEIYSILEAYENNFKKIFKVKAEFDYEMNNDNEAVSQYAGLIGRLVEEEGLRHFDVSAIARVVEYGAKVAGRKTRLTTRFSEIADIVREANYWCGFNNHEFVTAKDVETAIREYQNRYKMPEEKIQEMIIEDSIMIDTSGERVGQVNGLAVYDLGRYSFGKPSRITATVAAGKDGIVNIEREANLSGRTHNKGVLILAGYLREQFAQEYPLSLTASIAFEQSYSGVDGDSASSTEIYAILSALSGIPIRQDLAVTGSVNQKGDIQPIGGVNEKIEGFFEVCNERGLTGTQGVMIPWQNVSDLMLKSEVVEAVREGTFHVYSIHHVREGIELLTGVAAGEKDENGRFPEGTVFGEAQKRLEAYKEAVKETKS